MSPTNQPGPTSQSDRVRYPELREELGEDPARYLASDETHLAHARIKALETIEEIQAWRRVEGEIREDSRPSIMRALHDREQHLDA